MLTYLLLLLNPHRIVLNHPIAWIILDICFYSMPFIYFIIYKYKEKFITITAFIMLLINVVYIQLYVLCSLDSIEIQVAWLLFPILFLTKKETSFYLLANRLRYYFLFFFSSAAIWKFTQHGIFNRQQFSNILLVQHKEILTSKVTAYQCFIFWLINHSTISYLMTIRNLV